MTTPLLIDSHCHLDFDDFAPERDAVVARARTAGVGLMVTISTRVRRFERILALIERYPEVFGTVGTHPHNAHEELDRYKAAYAANRDMLMKRLPEIGFSIASPMDGAFYAYADVTRFTNDSMAFAKRMLAEINVAATPGFDFDPLEGHRTMRFSYAGAEADMVEAMDRIARWLA